LFDYQLDRAVRAWQRDRHLPVDGVVLRGDFVYFGTMPVNAIANDTIILGKLLSGGEASVRVLPIAPSIEVVVSPEQRSQASPGETQVLLDNDWQGLVSGFEEAKAVDGSSTQRLLLKVTSVSGGDLCDARCATRFPAGAPNLASLKVSIVPKTTGPAVPVAAIATANDGIVSVLLVNGKRQPVRILRSSRGLAIVEGVAVGDVVQLGGNPSNA
jgi:peptidoglycan hydrolase-like protein with peptidoglycan-binding domain